MMARFIEPATKVAAKKPSAGSPPARTESVSSRNSPRRRTAGFSLAAATLVAGSAFAANESLLTAPDLPPYQWFASTDPKNQNEDYLLLKPGETRKIPLSTGRLERFWFTGLEADKLRVELGKRYRLRNGNSAMAYSQIHGNAFLLMSDEVFWWDIFNAMHPAAKHSEGIGPRQYSLSAPSYFSVTNLSKNPEGNKFFYQVTIRPESRSAPAPTGAKLDKQEKISLAPGAEQAIELSGAGLVQTMTLTPQNGGDVKPIWLYVSWDGAAQNAVDAPLGALLNLFEGGNEVKSAAFDSDGKTATLKWPMTFGKGAKITFKNEGDKAIDCDCKISGLTLKQAPPYRFYAVYGSARTEENKMVRMLNVDGKGAFVGLNLSIKPAPDSARRTFAYLEGNETITADGKAFEGTGTEDFFSSAWYFPKQPFSFPYHGMTFKSETPPAVNAYRLMIPDAVPFKKSLQFDFEHGKGNNSNDLIYRWVAFWYAEPSAKFEVPNTAASSAESGGAAPIASPDGSLTGGVSQSSIILTALITALVVGGGGALIVKLVRKENSKTQK